MNCFADNHPFQWSSHCEVDVLRRNTAVGWQWSHPVSFVITDDLFGEGAVRQRRGDSRWVVAEARRCARGPGEGLQWISGMVAVLVQGRPRHRAGQQAADTDQSAARRRRRRRRRLSSRSAVEPTKLAHAAQQSKRLQFTIGRFLGALRFLIRRVQDKMNGLGAGCETHTGISRKWPPVVLCSTFAVITS